jgi:hypothetical protein
LVSSRSRGTFGERRALAPLFHSRGILAACLQGKAAGAWRFEQHTGHGVIAGHRTNVIRRWKEISVAILNPNFGITIKRDRQRFVLPPQSIRSASPKKLNRQGRPMRSLDANHI